MLRALACSSAIDRAAIASDSPTSRLEAARAVSIIRSSGPGSMERDHEGPGFAIEV